MKVHLTIQVGESAVIHELNNVQEGEYEALLGLARSSNKTLVTFTWDGGLSELSFVPYELRVVHATRSQP